METKGYKQQCTRVLLLSNLALELLWKGKSGGRFKALESSANSCQEIEKQLSVSRTLYPFSQIRTQYFSTGNLQNCTKHDNPQHSIRTRTHVFTRIRSVSFATRHAYKEQELHLSAEFSKGFQVDVSRKKDEMLFLHNPRSLEHEIGL